MKCKIYHIYTKLELYIEELSLGLLGGSQVGSRRMGSLVGDNPKQQYQQCTKIKIVFRFEICAKFPTNDVDRSVKSVIIQNGNMDAQKSFNSLFDENFSPTKKLYECQLIKSNRVCVKTIYHQKGLDEMNSMVSLQGGYAMK